MFPGGLILGFTLVAFACWLHYNEKHGWDYEQDDTDVDQEYLERRRSGRHRVHWTLGGCGVLILIATFAGPGFVWGVCWMLVSCALLAVVVMAVLDGLRTHRYHRQKLPEIRRRLLGDDD